MCYSAGAAARAHTGHKALCPVCHAFQCFPALDIGAYCMVNGGGIPSHNEGILGRSRN
eukprot:COSAG02_NODE_306_length_25175_cov_76.540118_14_plen_58_part_00